MKKLVLLLIASCVLVFSLLGWKILSYEQGQIDLHPEADFYILYPDKVEAYQLKDYQPSLLSTQKMKSEQYLGSGRNHILQDRYLIYSNDGYKSFSENIVSIDFQTGNISRQPSSDYSYISGADAQHFYTAGSYHSLTMFDEKGKKVLQQKLDDHFIFQQGILPTSRGDIYLNGYEYDPDKPGSRENMLYVLDKTDLAFKEKIPFDNHAIVESGLVVADTLYLPVSYYFQEPDQMTPSYDILTYRPEDKAWGKIELSKPETFLIHTSFADRYLLIEHDGLNEKEVQFTVLDLETGNQAFLGLGTLGDQVGALSEIRFLDQHHLLFVYDDHLTIYNWQTAEIISQTTLSSDYISGIWINP